jgi:hypothetical protein
MSCSVVAKNFIHAFFALTLLLAGKNAMSLEQPDYTVIYKENGIEFRVYQPYLITETFIKGGVSYKNAGNIGFKRLFSYITGNNVSQTDVEMTAPVKQIPSSENISMTAPVNTSRDNNGYRVSFVLPKKYSLDTAPKPLDPRVSTVEVPEKTIAVLRYSGRWTTSNFEKYRNKLLEKLNEQGIKTQGEVNSAFYNSPFTIPIFRRNEVMITVVDFPAQTI